MPYVTYEWVAVQASDGLDGHTTIDFHFPPSWVFAFTSLNSFYVAGTGGYAYSGILSYQTEGSDQPTFPSPTGNFGLNPQIGESNVVLVTFEWGIFAPAGGEIRADISFQAFAWS